MARLISARSGWSQMRPVLVVEAALIAGIPGRMRVGAFRADLLATALERALKSVARPTARVRRVCVGVRGPRFRPWIAEFPAGLVRTLRPRNGDTLQRHLCNA